MIRPPFVNNQIYHIFNRGVEKRNIFTCEADYLRFLYNLLTLNTTETPPRNTNRVIKKQEIRDTLCKVEPCTGQGLVEILVFTLMPNHYHLMVRQLVDGGIVKFMQKIGTGYTMYFNTKNERVGSLFQGRFKAVLVEKDSHFLYLPHYIHLNPLELMPSTMQGSKSDNTEAQIKFLENYKWSSLQDYIGKENFSTIINKSFLMETFGGEDSYKKEMAGWVKNNKRKKFKQQDLGGVALD